MRFLLDSHIFLWFISGDAHLPADWRDSIRDPGNEVYLSVVSIRGAADEATGLMRAGAVPSAVDSALCAGWFGSRRPSQRSRDPRQSTGEATIPAKG
jgi:hypothetical protein